MPILRFGTPDATLRGMLRITLPAASRSGSFILEGRLTGLWAKELLRVARYEGQSQSNVFDLREVFYVDSRGEDALRWLAARGAKFITESAYGKDLCARLNLHRVGVSEVGETSRERLAPHRPHERRRSQAVGLNALATADGNQQPPSWRG